MSLNQCAFIGNLGRDPEVKTMQSGDKVANLSIGVSERWKDRATGERKERTTWVPIVIWGPLAGVAEQYLRKGSKVFVQGKFSVRKWADKDGQDRYSTEVVLQGPQAVLQMLDGAKGGDSQSRSNGSDNDGYRPKGAQSGGGGDGWTGGEQRQGGFADDLDDDLPFITRSSAW